MFSYLLQVLKQSFLSVWILSASAKENSQLESLDKYMSFWKFWEIHKKMYPNYGSITITLGRYGILIVWTMIAFIYRKVKQQLTESPNHM